MRTHFSKGGLRKWVKENWVDIGAPKKNRMAHTRNVDEVEEQRIETKVSKMRAHLQKPQRMSKVAKGECCERELQVILVVPTNVKTFA
jgi:hypothetical protein